MSNELAVEHRFLAGLLRYGAKLHPVAQEILPQTQGAIDAHERLFNAIYALQVRDETVDAISLGHEIGNKWQGPQSIDQTLDEILDLDPLESDAKLAGAVWRDRLIARNAGGQLAKLSALAGAMSPAHLNERVLQLAGGINVPEQTDIVSSAKAYELATQDHADEREAYRRDGLLGVPTGFPRLDRMIKGMRGGSLNIVAGRPGTGKTAFALNVLHNVAVERQKRVLFVSLEMSAQSLYQRLLGIHSRKKLGDIYRDWRNQDMKRYHDALCAAPIHFAEKWRTLDQITSYMHGQDPSDLPALLIVDYLQLLKPSTGGRFNSRYEEVTAVSLGLKQLAMEFGIPVFAPCQVNRTAENLNKREQVVVAEPFMSQLRDSGAIEQDADVVMLIATGTGRDMETELLNTDAMPVRFKVDKHRHGKTGVIPALFDKSTQRFDEMAEDADNTFEPRHSVAQ